MNHYTFQKLLDPAEYHFKPEFYLDLVITYFYSSNHTNLFRHYYVCPLLLCHLVNDCHFKIVE